MQDKSSIYPTNARSGGKDSSIRNMKLPQFLVTTFQHMFRLFVANKLQKQENKRIIKITKIIITKSKNLTKC